jgi:hypothetical protein
MVGVREREDIANKLSVARRELKADTHRVRERERG